MTIVRPRTAAAPAPRTAAMSEHLQVSAWPDPLVERHGHDPRSRYVERFWLPAVGPTCTWLLRRAADAFDDIGDPFELRSADLAGAIGLGGRQGRHAPLPRALARLVAFDLARWQGPSTLAVRRALPPLLRHQVARLPAALRTEHDAWCAAELRRTPLERQQRRAMEVVLRGLEAGRELLVLASLLQRSGMHPAPSKQVLSWAAAAPGTGGPDR